MAFITAGLLAAGVATAQKKQVGIGAITPTHSLRETADKTGQTDSLNHLIESLNEHLIVTFQQSNKFQIVARSDLGQILKDQQIPVGAIRDPEELKELPGKIKGLDYLVLGAVTDFSDHKSGMFVQSLNMRVDVRVVQANLILKIYNTTTGALVEAVNIPVRQEDKGTSRVPQQGYSNNAPDDSLIEGVVNQLAQQSVNRVVDIIYPARIIAITDNQVTINRGQGSGVAPNQVWEVFALGNEMIDPDTGASLGREEIKVGEIQISDVLPEFSKGTIIGENHGIDRGAIVRPKLQSTPPPAQ
ncbi:MAG TPA: CsgG/HfaB family protein [Tepidisphaeraceae bacterium]|nr:CsgG/HfaB family protein [Tepidisphaeraceae bacterium]